MQLLDHPPQHNRTAGGATPLATPPVLLPCVYIAVQCSRCGDVRQASPELPASAAILCPHCGTDCSYILLGSGFTRRKLPFYEVRSTEAQLLHRRDEAPEIGPSFSRSRAGAASPGG